MNILQWNKIKLLQHIQHIFEVYILKILHKIKYQRIYINYNSENVAIIKVIF
jgi:hypothetical protein